MFKKKEKEEMYLLVIFLPLIGSLFSLSLPRIIGIKGVKIINISSMLLANILTPIIFYEVGLNNSIVTCNLYNFLEIDNLFFNISFTFDSLTISMVLPILFISLLIHIYTLGYMENDPHLQRFIGILSLFTFFMIILITSNNYLSMFVGWEGIGVCSFLLINYWFTRIEANKSAIQAIIVNRVGDLGYIIMLILMINIYGSFDYIIINNLSYYIDITYINILTLFIILGAIVKSAQIPFHIWLPNAMEGPTPVSALLHSSTMVTAGIYLILRSSILMELSDNLILLVIIGSLTCIIGGTIGLFQNDMKKIIAYSTSSQLGYMMLACGLSLYDISYFHFFNHAFFKALLFLSAGSVIHAINDEQDIRKMGNLINILPFTFILFVIGSLNIMGLPFMSGYYSKDAIIELSYSTYLINGNINYIIGSLTALITSIYSIKIIYNTFYNETNSIKENYINAHEPNNYMFIPLLILSFISIFVGYIFKDIFIGMGTDFWFKSMNLVVHPNHLISIEGELINIYVKLLPTFFVFLAFILYFMLNKKYNILLNTKLIHIYRFINQKYLIDLIYNYYITNKLILSLGYISFKLIDRGMLEYIGPYGLKIITKKMLLKLDVLDNDNLSHRIVDIIIGFFFFITIALFIY